MGGKVNILKKRKRCSKTKDIVSYALEVSVNGVTCVCSWSISGHQTHFKGLKVNIHVSTKTCVIGNNLVLHHALAHMDRNLGEDRGDKGSTSK